MSLSPKKLSVLVVGSTGKTGQQLINQLGMHPSCSSVHAFCRDESKFNPGTRKLCASVVKGNARNEIDIEQALTLTGSDWMVICVGNGESVAKNDIRTSNAKATVNVLMQQPQFQHVRAMIVSSTGAGPSKIIVGLGIGKLISHHLRHVLADHTGQEQAFRKIQERAIIVRPTSLTDDKATKKLIEFGDTQKSPTIKTDRSDLASWIVHEICESDNPKLGQAINITGAK